MPELDAASDGGDDGVDEPKEPDAKPDAARPAAKELTDDEKFQRAVQAEADRRDAKRTREQHEANTKKLRDEDPEEYVRRERETEALQQSLGVTAQIFDEALLTPVMLAVPEKDREEIIAAGIQGLAGRSAAITKALERIRASEYERGKAEGAKEAETKLRKNPAVLKQVLVDQREDGTEDEPELVTAGGAPAPKTDGNTFLRQLYRSSRS